MNRLLVFLLSLSLFTSACAAAEMAEEELQGLFEVMGELLEDSSWAETHPSPCTDTPWPGILCDQLHVTRLHIGPDLASPPCRPAATLPSFSLLKLPYLRSLSLIGCFVNSTVSLSSTLFTSASLLEQLVIKSSPGLSGSIPASIALLSRLKKLALSQTRLHGDIPPELGAMSELEEIDLSYNRLSGRIPENVSGLTSLSILDLSWNSLHGRLPRSLGKLAALQKMDLSENSLSGEIPEELGSLKRLQLLDLSKNSLKSFIPESIGELRNLAVLSLSGCGLNGEIPPSITWLTRLSALSLDGNRLNGTVPAELEKLPSLRQLNLSNNELSGVLPFGEQFVARLGSRLDVRENKGLVIPACTNSSSSSSSSAAAARTQPAAKSPWRGGAAVLRGSSPAALNACFSGSLLLLLF